MAALIPWMLDPARNPFDALGASASDGVEGVLAKVDAAVRSAGPRELAEWEAIAQALREAPERVWLCMFVARTGGAGRHRLDDVLADCAAPIPADLGALDVSEDQARAHLDAALRDPTQRAAQTRALVELPALEEAPLVRGGLQVWADEVEGDDGPE